MTLAIAAAVVLALLLYTWLVAMVGYWYGKNFL